MKLSCIQSNLRKGLATVSRAVATRSTIPETQNVLMATDNGRLKLTATNLEIAITTWIGAQIEEEGSVTIPARMLSDFINTLPDKKVDIETVPSPTGMKIHCANFDAQMNGIDPENYPPIPNISDGPKVSISSSDFKSSLSRVRFAVASDESRPALTGVKVDVKGNELTLASADGFRLAIESGSCESSVDEDVSVIVPGRTMNEIFSLLGTDSGMLDMTVTEQKSQALFKFGDVEVVTQLIQGNFPDYERLIPSEKGTTCRVNREDLLQATNAASVFARDGSGIIRMVSDDSEEGSVRIMSQAEELGSNESRVKASIEGEETRIAFNSKFLNEILSVLDGDEVEIETMSPSSPGVFRSAANSGYIHIIMPMFVQW
ncbi:DNA polymerase III subunit beta [Chloroflexi bacterium]|jgi:DNA polymerase-3 subunit beta|nr:DNA polymerase III subunit beta [Chloroflexota bacterium]MDC0252530.1 DNA polymerase III subunit beta [Chloroflexota bacterium]RZP14212.1 MAG: DNA polymerase III subunit beta [Chloroflexota bacterium]|tara:strand:- start:1070 stop:2194 length:1125 start_codon:yes stop_codon:yes gene_type:complete